ncbi:unnamed protein product [Tilletia controversa]|uniref:PPPDE domain-containing protein n=1 Tax=Tilletia controversa TaxID=13291 RepID=A0A8X7MQL6_9BASI|nr:hypothetical protein CF328_g4773 [Tilletia controversa]KAE8245556.1 hypothetical protein A4X06_0g5601 [Tilletia controversa]CAD6911814.1 unnamed protein product [Tilletia controversa]CAD6918959.1 unnamed protein product [Tilletia controversa]CAD6958223.1 unnamed protein product [Tilletia controversa]
MSDETDTFPVQLYLYDLSHGMASQLSLALTGRHFEAVWHTGIIVHGQEYFFGQGVFTCAPGKSHHGQPMEIIELGRTAIDRDTWLEMLAELRKRYTASAYHLLNFNCNTFSNEVSELLTGNTIPERIRSLPQDFLATPLGQMFRPQIDSTFSNGLPTASSSNSPIRARKNRKPSAAALGAAQSEAAAASRVLDGVIEQATTTSASEWNVAGKDNAAESANGKAGPSESHWNLEKALETFLTRQAAFDDPTVQKSVQERLEKMLSAKSDFRPSESSSRIPKRILCLGLGTVRNSAIPQLQLALLLLLRDHLSTMLGDFCTVEAFDPVFTEDDRELLQALGVDVLEENKRGAYVLDEPTLVYMPHVGRGLTEQLLRANWSEDGLENMYLCCNDLDVYVTHVAQEKLRRESPCLYKLAPHLVREPVPEPPKNHPQTQPGAFNDIAFQRFAPTSELPSDFWALPEKVRVADPETI